VSGCGKVKPEVERMIRMDQYSFIRTAHRVYGKSIRQISRETGHSRETTRKVLRQEPYVYTPRQQQRLILRPGNKQCTKKPKKGGSNFDYHDGSFFGCHYHQSMIRDCRFRRDANQ
jgi:hypothetical protein